MTWFLNYSDFESFLLKLSFQLLSFINLLYWRKPQTILHSYSLKEYYISSTFQIIVYKLLENYKQSKSILNILLYKVLSLKIKMSGFGDS